jgi:hypothetical protein
MTKCECKSPGWCERHAVIKTKRWWELCRTSQEYFDAWENNSGPGQAGPRESRVKRRPPLDVPYLKAGRVEWITNAKLAEDSVKLASMLPGDVDAIVAVPRSGMIPASIIACMLHLPLLTIVDGKVVTCGSGHRLCDPNQSGQRMAFIDDTLAGGSAYRKLVDTGNLTYPHLFAVVYSSVDNGDHLFVKHVPFPHLLEWNLFNSCYLPSVATDMDGVLCHNPPHGSTPLYLPRKQPIKAVITARQATLRVETLKWLERQSIQYERLYMWPSKSHAEDQLELAAWKASMVREAKAEWYIESEPGLADLIRSHGIRVLCPAQGYME